MAFVSTLSTSNNDDVSTVFGVNIASHQVRTANLSDATMYDFLANQPNGSQLVHEDQEKIHEDDLKEIDLKWQLALLSMRAKRFFQKTGKKITINESDTAGYDKAKVECFNCHKMGNFVREYRVPRNQKNITRNQETIRRTLNVEDTSSKAMMEINRAGFDWSYMADDEAPTNMAFMAFFRIKDSKIAVLKSKLEKISKEKDDIEIKIKKFENASQSLDKLIESQITDKSKRCLGYVSYNAIPPPQIRRFSPPRIDLSYTGLPEFAEPALKAIELSQLKWTGNQKERMRLSPPEIERKTVEPSVDKKERMRLSPPEIERKTVEPSVDKVEVDIPKQNDKLARRPVKYAKMYKTQRPRDSKIAVLKSKLEKISKEKDDIEIRIEKFENASQSLDKLIESQITDKSKRCLGYVSNNAIPPPQIRRFSHPRIDLSHTGLPEFAEPNVKSYRVKPIEVVTQTSSVKIFEPVKENNNEPLIEDWESEREDEVESLPVIERKTVEPSVDKVEVDIPKQNDKLARRPVKYAKMYKTQRPRGLIICRLGANTIKEKGWSVNPKSTRRSFQRRTTYNNKNFSQKVNTAKGKVNTARPNSAVLNVVRINKGKAVKALACWVWRPIKLDSASIVLKKHTYIDARGISKSEIYPTSLTSRSLMEGMLHLGEELKVGTGKGIIRTGKLDFEDAYFVKELKFNLFSVSQMCDKRNNVLFTDTECFVLSLDFKLAGESHVLLKVPRKNNMYSVDMKNIVAKKDLTCLVTKSTNDESMLWHMRLGLINFKNINKLVKENLVRDEGFFVVYSTNSKAFRVYNTRTRKVEVNLHIKFLENKPIITRDGPKWLFDIDDLTESMNYVQVIAGTNSNDFAGKGASFDADQSSMEIGHSQDYILVPLWNDGSIFDSSSKDSYGDNKDNDGSCKESEIDNQERPNAKNSTKDVNTAGPSINTTNLNINTDSLKVNIVRQSDDFFGADNDMRSLDGVEVFISNIFITYHVLTTPNTRIHKDHSLNNVIGDMQSGVQTRRMTVTSDEQGFISAIYEEKTHEDLHTWVYQEEGIDYDEVFSPVARIEAIRLFLAYASFIGFLVYQMDVKSAFLYRRIEEEVYVCQPLGFEDPDYPDKVYKELCTEFEKLMHDKFQMSSIGEITFFLRLQVKQKLNRIFISHDKYVDEILRKFKSMIRSSTTNMAEFDIGQEDDKFWRTASARTLNNEEIELNAIIDGQDISITETSVRRHLKLADADGISSLPTTEIFEQLALMGKTRTRTRRMDIRIPQSNVPSSVANEAITKEMHDGLRRATATASSLEAKQSSDPSGSGRIIGLIPKLDHLMISLTS
nr:ribonuclease H-like domain-containing protein [Tanacetum cinerariifolium]